MDKNNKNTQAPEEQAPVAPVEQAPDRTSTSSTTENFKNNFNVEFLLPTAGTLKITKEQESILYAPVEPNDVEIRPDGLIYLPWMEYVTRLRLALGCQWAIIPNGMPAIRDDLVIWGFYLIIDGRLMGYSIGEQQYYPGNFTMSYTDACEGAKSNALMRLCKGIGIGLELWRPSFIREWKNKNAYSYIDVDKYGHKKTYWKKGKKPITEIPEQPTQDEQNPFLDKNEKSKENIKKTATCDSCSLIVDDIRVVNYSLKKYQKILCYECQQLEWKKNNTKKYILE